jgi:GNAT superfamily N-acetyltransferase
VTVRKLAGDLELDDDPVRIDVEAVHRFLALESYWAKGRAQPVVAALVRGAARVVGLYDGPRQIGFARVVSDGHVVAYLADVYVLPAYRGRGLGIELVREAVENGPQAGLRWLLHTQDAHGLYERFGFAPPPDTLLERPRSG